jgi:pyruvate/2-oxoglutarate dehydrogenase complex dihydrolipoamide dehydrogenase (E3) component
VTAPAPSRYDLLVVGGGTAGLVASAGAASLGARTALVEKERLGGECLWTGCVPSKALIGSARIADALGRRAEFGLTEVRGEGAGIRPEGRAATAGVLESVRAVRARVQPHDDPERFRKLGVEVLEGAPARFLSPDRVQVGDRVLEGRNILVATGSRPAIPPVEGLAEVGFYTHETAFEEETLPRSVVILGAGPIGVEFAQAYARLGVEITVVEMAPRILPNEDGELTGQLEEHLRSEGVRVLTGMAATSAERSGSAEMALKLAAADDSAGQPETVRAVSAERIFVATGRRPNVESLGLEEAGVATGGDGILVDGRLRTSRRHIFAAGDVTGGLRFTHVADHEARSVLRNALFPFGRRVDYSVVPWTVFTDPPLARVGLTEEEARDRQAGVRTYRYDTSGLDRVITDREAGGLVKLIADRRGRLLGGHVLAPSAGTMIMEVALAMRHGLRIADLSTLIHPYPTMGEGIRRAADMYYRGKLTSRSRRWLDRYFRLTRRLSA